jgi:hypothetical protein
MPEERWNDAAEGADNAWGTAGIKEAGEWNESPLRQEKREEKASIGEKREI